MNKLFRTSKLIMWLFICLFIYVIYKGINYDFSSLSYVDTAIFCACIASVGGIVGAIITKYYNNSNAENIPKIQLDLYKKSMRLRLQYNEKMLALLKEYNASKDELYDIESEFNMDEVTDGILNQAISELDSKSSESHENIHIQNY